MFVDDDPNLLEGLKRVLRPMRSEWQMTFAGSAEEALGYIDREPYDVLVTDLLMPEVNGVELLRQVKARQPQMIRLVLTGHVHHDIMVRAMELAHQFIAKPVDVSRLREIIGRSTALHRLLEAPKLRRLIAGMRSLPSLPDIYVQIMEELKSPGGSMLRVGRIIASDLGMSAKVLQLVNSAYFGLSHTVTDPAQAAVFLGMDTIRAMVLSTHVFSEISPEQLAKFKLEFIWEHSFRVAGTAREIAKWEGAPAGQVDMAFMGGMFHDIGKIVFAMNIPDDYFRAMRLAEQSGLAMFKVERDLIGVTHAEVGAYLLGLWGFPDPIVEAVCLHHTPNQSGGDGFSPLTAVHAADILCRGAGAEEALAVESENYLKALGLEQHFAQWRELHENAKAGIPPVVL